MLISAASKDAPRLLLELARQVTLDECRLAGSCDASDRPDAGFVRTAVADKDELEGLRPSGLLEASLTDRHARSVAHAGQMVLMIEHAGDRTDRTREDKRLQAVSDRLST